VLILSAIYHVSPSIFDHAAVMYHVCMYLLSYLLTNQARSPEVSDV